jgi:hypothetical protein
LHVGVRVLEVPLNPTEFGRRFGSGHARIIMKAFRAVVLGSGGANDDGQEAVLEIRISEISYGRRCG